MENINGLNVYSDFKNTPIGFLQDGVEEGTKGKSLYKAMVQQGMLAPQLAYPFLGYKGRMKVLDQMYGPKSSNPVMTSGQINAAVWTTMTADAAQAMHASGKFLGQTKASKKAFFKDMAKRITTEFFDAAPADGSTALGYATSRTTEFVEPRAYVQVRKPYSLASGKVMPVITEGGAGAELYTANYINRTGEMKVTNADAGNDLPVVTGNVSFVRTPLIAAAASYRISINELAVSEFAKMNPLMAGVPSYNNLQLQAAIESYLSLTDQLMAYGMDSVGLPGLFNNPDITPVSVAQNEAATSTLWSEKSQNEILADVLEPLVTITAKTGGTLLGTMACFTAEDFQFLATSASNDFDKKPFLAYFRTYIGNFSEDIDGVLTDLSNIDPDNIAPSGQMNAGNLRIVWSDRFEGIGGPVTPGVPADGYYNGFMVYSGGDESALKGIVPLPMTTLAPQWQGISLVTPFWCKQGGTISRYPDAVQIRTGNSITFNPTRNELIPVPDLDNPIGS
jgi:hypothetical protein